MRDNISDIPNLVSPMAGTVSAIVKADGDRVAKGEAVLYVEAMKMEAPVEAPLAGLVAGLKVSVGDQVLLGEALGSVTSDELEAAEAISEGDVGESPGQRSDLIETVERHEKLYDVSRPEAVKKVHARGRRTARENLQDLCDEGSFVEYGGLAVAAQRNRRSMEDLIERTPADGLICGLAKVNGERFGGEAASVAVVSYDYMVMAGTQGLFGHLKKDRIFEVVERTRIPAVLFAEGGGGRPSDTDRQVVAALDVPAFALWAGLSGVVPRIGVGSGYCFAGNALLFGCSDITIATPNISVGMGGPAMIEGAGLGEVDAKDVGPFETQVLNGVVDVPALDDADAVRLAKKAISYFQGSASTFSALDQEALRTSVPESRVRPYDVGEVVSVFADEGSVLVLREANAPEMYTALARLEGRPIGIVANNALHRGGAITSAGASKAARFLQICEAFRLPVVFLCDTPGIMVGPEAERTGTVRHASRLFVAGSTLTVPFVTVVLRKAYGLGAQAMCGGHTHRPLLTVAWPTGEFGAMGLEGAVRLAMRKDLEAIESQKERQDLFEAMVAIAYDRGKALNTASLFEIDDVIDPAETRNIVAAVFSSAPKEHWRDLSPRRIVDTF